MFAMPSSGTLFKVDSYACTAVAISSAACGLGIACDVWFLLRYIWVDLKTFIVRSTFLTLTLTGSYCGLIVPLPWRIWFIRLLLTVLTRAHLLHADLFHLTPALRGARRIRCKALRCCRDWGLGNSRNDAPVYCVWDTLLCYICFACLESPSSEGFRGLDCFLWSKFLVVAFLLYFFLQIYPLVWWVPVKSFIIQLINVPPMLHRFPVVFYPTHAVAPYYLLFCCQLLSLFFSQPFPPSEQYASWLQIFEAHNVLIIIAPEGSWRTIILYYYNQSFTSLSHPKKKKT